MKGVNFISRLSEKKSITMQIIKNLIIIVVLIIIPILLPSEYYINLISTILIFALLAMSLNILVGYTGLSSLGHAGFFGAAGYCAGVINILLGRGFLASFIGALVFSILLAAIFGFINVRTKGTTFFMVTIALGQILWGASQTWTSITGGANGMIGFSDPSFFGIQIKSAQSYYYLIIVVFIICFYIIYRLINSSFGLTLRGIKDNSKRMSHLGYNIYLHVWIAYVISGTFAGIAGILFVFFNHFNSPEVLSLVNSAKALMMVLVGGVGTFGGPLLGAVIIVSLENLISTFTNRWVLIMGLLYIIVVLFSPEGLLVLFKKYQSRFLAQMKTNRRMNDGEQRKEVNKNSRLFF